MIKTIKSFTKKYKLITLLVIVVVVSLFTSLIIELIKPTLTITALPEGSTIIVDNKGQVLNHYSKHLDKGEHKLAVSKEGYETVEQTIFLDKPTKITIDLNQLASPWPTEIKTENTKIVGPYTVTEFSNSGSGDFFAINQTNGNLVRLTESGLKTVYGSVVYSYTYTNPIIALVKGFSDRNEIVIINTQQGTTKIVPVKEIAPVSSVVISSDLKKLYLLGKFDLRSRKSILFESPIDKFEPKELFTTTAIDLNLLESNLILYETPDETDRGRLSVFDISSKGVVFSAVGNSYQVSPDKKNLLLVSSTGLTLYNSASKTKKFYTLEKIIGAVWKDNQSFIALSKGMNGVLLSIFKVPELIKTKSLTNKALNDTQIRWVNGLINNVLYITNLKGEMVKIILQ